MKEPKCYLSDAPRMTATQEFIDKNKFKLRTQEEIVAKVKEYISQPSMFDFRPEVLMEHLNLESVKEFVKEEYLAKVNSGEIQHEFCDNVLEATQDFLDYMNFAWGEAEDERSLSASRSIQKLGAFLWLLNREDLVEVIDNDDLYNPYGAPALIEVCNQLGVEVPTSLIEFAKHKC